MKGDCALVAAVLAGVSTLGSVYSGTGQLVSVVDVTGPGAPFLFGVLYSVFLSHVLVIVGIPSPSGDGGIFPRVSVITGP